MKNTSRATCSYLSFLKKTNLVDSSAVYFYKRNIIRVPRKKNACFSAPF